MRIPGGLFPVVSESVQDTRRVAADFATLLVAGDVVALYGDLGTGKTEFVRGVCENFGIDAASVTSPTFTIVNEYKGDQVTIYHVDAYRIEDESEIFDLGFEEYLSEAAIVFVEWPERIPSLLDDAVIRLRFEHRTETARQITLLSQ